MLRINIPTPCHEDWQNMQANERGRHCAVCAKTVIDFTSMTDEEVRNFFIHKNEAKVCGRFNAEQLHRSRIDLPSNILQLQMPWWKRFLVASLLVFGTSLFSCDTTTKGDIDTEQVKTGNSSETTTAAISPVPPIGGMIIQWDSTETRDTICSLIKGDISIDLEDPGEVITGMIIPIDSPELVPVPEIFKADSLFIETGKPVPKLEDIRIQRPPNKDSLRCDSIPTDYS